MVHTFTKLITQTIGGFPLAFASTLLIPGLAMADFESQPCSDTHQQIEHTKKTLHASEQRQQQLQQNVRATYQELFACNSGTLLSITQQQHCSHLQEEGPKQFQAMIEVTTLNHQTTKLLAQQTRLIQLNCESISGNTYPEIISLAPLKKIAMKKEQRRVASDHFRNPTRD